MTKTLEFLFDFGSPNAYLAWKILPGIAARTGAALIETPVLLGGIFKATNNQPPMVAFGGVKGKLAYEMLETDRFVKRHGLDRYRFNPNFPVNTLQIMRGAVAAGLDGGLSAYCAAVYPAMWENGLKMDDPAIIAQTLNEAGLDGARMLARIGEPDVKAKLAANTDAAVARGVFGIPSFFADGDLYFGKDRLRDVEERLA
jgi:2-hydroxychromene-2-carboxylate isomerase